MVIPEAINSTTVPKGVSGLLEKVAFNPPGLSGYIIHLGFYDGGLQLLPAV